MRHAALVRLRLSWPREVGQDQVAAAWRRLPAVAGWPLVVEAMGHGGQVEHCLTVPANRQRVVVGQLQAELPDLAVDIDTAAAPHFERAAVVRMTTRRRAIVTDDLAGASRGLLTALAMTVRSEWLVVQWVLGRPLHPQATPGGSAPLTRESWLRQSVDALFGIRRRSDHEPRQALAAKQSLPGWRALGRLAVAADGRERQEFLLRQLAGALRALEAPGLRLVVQSRRPPAVRDEAIPWRWPLRLNASELAALSGWPVGLTRDLPVTSLTSRLLKAPAAIPRSGRVIGESTFPGSKRPLALGTAASLRHCQVLGPTGVGKSTLLLNLITQDLVSGHGVVVIEPKGDLIADVLARVPAERTGDVVLVEPADTDRPVGLNPLAPMGRSPELVADQLLGIFHDLYASHWGPRTQDILGAALLTLAQVPGMTLVAVPVLLTNPAFRRSVVARIDDPVGLGPFWAGFESWSQVERTVAISPVLNKLRPFLMRPSLRGLLGQARPSFDLRDVFTRRRVLLVNLAKGQLGPEAAALLGSLLVGQLWQAAMGRSRLPAGRRRPVFCFIDEFQDYLRLPLDLADALAQARGLGVGLTLANQHLAQLTPGMRSAVLANAQSKVCFRLGADDARVLAAGSSLAPEDFGGLGAFQCYVQLVAADTVQPWVSGQTLPPPEVTSDPAVVRATSRANYGQERIDVEREIVDLMSGGRYDSSTVDDLTPKRRGGRP